VKFFSKYRPAIYIVEPRRNEVLPNGDKRLRDGIGLTAVFSNVPGGSILDTEEDSHGWNAEEREKVEQHLLGHNDFGFQLWLADEGVARAAQATTDTCMVMIQVPEGVRLCGREADATTRICAEHTAQLSQTPEPELPEPPGEAPYDQQLEEVTG
jgi:hypothetical protein